MQQKSLSQIKNGKEYSRLSKDDECLMENTRDLSQFGFRELRMAAELLNAYCDDTPDFFSDGVAVEFNPNSGNVFLVDNDFNIGMMNGKKLEQFFSCPECGHEGFKEDFKDHKKCPGYKSLFWNEEDE